MSLVRCVCKCAHLNMDNKIYDKANGGGGGGIVAK